MSEVKMLTSSDDKIFAATSGGVFIYLKNKKEFTKITNIDGLSSNNITAITTDKNKNIWIGHSNGYIDVYNPLNSTWKQIKDIFLSNKTFKSINNFYSVGDTILISTDFGLSVYNLAKEEFGDTFTNFATQSFPKVISGVVDKNRFFVLLENSLLISKENSVNLISPDSWKNVFQNIKPIGLTKFNDKIYCATDTAIYKFENENWIKVENINKKIFSISSSSKNLFAIHSNGFSNLNLQNLVSFKSFPEKINITSSVIDFEENLVIGSSDGIGYFTDNMINWNMILPNGPASKMISSIVIDKDDVLWTANALSLNYGFSTFDGTEWKNFTTFNFPNLPTNYIHTIILAPDDTKLLATHGSGIVKLNSKNEVEKIFNQISPGFVGISGSSSYILPLGMAFDNEENFWTTIYQANNLKVLWKLNKKDSTWQSFNAPILDNYNYQVNLIIDKNGTKWMGSALPGFTPLVSKFTFFNENTNYANSIDNWGLLTESQGITSSQINGFIIDKNDELWAATSNGITIIRNLKNPYQTISKVYNAAVRDIPINTIAIDALNNKWVGTQKGIFVLSPDGNVLLSHYDVSSTNGKLISNEINVIAINHKKGIVYFSTPEGLSSLEIETVKPEDDYSKLKVKPNPYFTNKNSQITITGLVENSTIKIFSSDGILIKSFLAQGGGRAFWDCKDKNGNTISSGIYFIVAFEEVSNKVSSTKLAVIKN